MALPRRKYLWLLFSIVFAGFIYQLDSCIVNISMPTLARDFRVGTNDISFVVLSYLLVVSSTLLLFGKLADRIGARKVFLWGYVVFTAGTLLCGVSPSLPILLLSRCVQGLGGSMLLTSAFAGVSRFMPPEVTGWAFGILSTASGLGLALGGPMGGFISSLVSWRWIFLVQVPFGIVATFVAWKVIPRESSVAQGSVEGEARPPFDIPGAVLSFLGLLAVVYALSMGQEKGWMSPGIVFCFIFSAASLSALILWERRCPDPLLHLNLFKNLEFTFPILGRFFASLASGGILFLLPFYLELIKNLDTGRSGLMISIYSIILVAIAPLSGRISDKCPPRLMSALAMLSASASGLVFAFTLPFAGLFWVTLFLCWAALSYGFFYPPNNLLIMRAVPCSELGIASGIMAATWTLGLSLGVSAFESVFSAGMAAAGVPAGTHIFAGASLPALLSGFGYAYGFGAMICALALILCLKRGTPK